MKVQCEESECPKFCKNVSFSTPYLFYVHPVVGIARTCFESTGCLTSWSWIFSCGQNMSLRA